FSDLYSFEKQLDSTLNGLKQRNIDASKDEESDSLHTATWSGIIYFTLDGLEQKKTSEFTRKGIESLAFERSSFSNGDEVANGSSVCKIISEENWDILVPITSDDYEYYKERDTARIYLTDLDVYETCGIKIIKDSEGGYYADLSLNDYMEAYSSDRVVGLQLCKNVITGLKIPKTSIVSHELYVIPTGFASVNDNSTEFVKRTEDGGTAKLHLSISYKDDQYYYIDDDQIQKGDMILEVDQEGTVTSNFYTIDKKETLKGVFNINKGYAVFVVVEVLDENDTYCIVKSGTNYGLTIYDHIVLNASTVSEDDLLY
ncbi:MAG: HlyD family efflux transporter periplasmic adaptor subunit, partial [Lachnospiraceae bacterium]